MSLERRTYVAICVEVLNDDCFEQTDFCVKHVSSPGGIICRLRFDVFLRHIVI